MHRGPTFLVPALLWGPAALPAAVQPLSYVNPARYEITQRVTVTNHDVSKLDSLELNLPVPLEWPAQQVRHLRAAGDDVFRLGDPNGLGEIVRSLYRDHPPGPGQTKSLRQTFQLIRREIRSDKAQLVGRHYPPYAKNDHEYRLYTRSEKMIEADAPEIAELAQRLGARTGGPYDFAAACYDYVIDHTEYASPSPSHGALDCLRRGKSDCGSYAALFVAVCRAGGVPARPVAGCWASGENQWHCWAEFLLPEVGWIPVDPTAADQNPGRREYYFGNLDNNRVALVKTYNLSVDTNRGSTELGFAQVGTWWWFPAPGSTGSKMSVEFHVRGNRLGR